MFAQPTPHQPNPHPNPQPYHLHPNSPPEFPFSPHWTPFPPAPTATPPRPPSRRSSHSDSGTIVREPPSEQQTILRIINRSPEHQWGNRSPSPKRIPRRRRSAQWMGGWNLPPQPPPPVNSPPYPASPPFHQGGVYPYYQAPLSPSASPSIPPYQQEQHHQLQQQQQQQGLSRDELRRQQRLAMAIPEDPQDDDELFDVGVWLGELDKWTLGDIGRE